jgi:hypothetical protein
MDERALSKLLLALAGKDASEGTPRETGCPALPRLRSALLREDATDAERRHVETCPRCQQAWRQLQAQVWHPTLLHLYWHTRGLLAADADVRCHLDDGCCRCLRLAAVLAADPVLDRLAARLREDVAGAAAARLGRTLASAAVGTLPGGFEDRCPVALRVMVRQVGDPSRLALHLPPSPEPRLVRVLAGDQERADVLFAVPRPERDHHSAVLALSPSPRAALVVYEVAPELLHRDDGPALQAAFAAAARTDPLALAAWQRWAERTQGQPDLDPGLRPVLAALARLNEVPDASN